MVIRLKLKISRKNIWHLDQDNSHAFVCHWASPSDVFSPEPDIKMSSFCFNCQIPIWKSAA